MTALAPKLCGHFLLTHSRKGGPLSDSALFVFIISCFFLFATVDANRKPPESQGLKWFSLDGAAIQIRTGDLILTNDALYQLSYSSTITAQL